MSDLPTDIHNEINAALREATLRFIFNLGWYAREHTLKHFEDLILGPCSAQYKDEHIAFQVWTTEVTRCEFIYYGWPGQHRETYRIYAQETPIPADFAERLDAEIPNDILRFLPGAKQVVKNVEFCPRCRHAQATVIPDKAIGDFCLEFCLLHIRRRMS